LSQIYLPYGHRLTYLKSNSHMAPLFTTFSWFLFIYIVWLAVMKVAEKALCILMLVCITRLISYFLPSILFQRHQNTHTSLFVSCAALVVPMSFQTLSGSSKQGQQPRWSPLSIWLVTEPMNGQW
jgi:hypothetical protein